MPCLAHGKQSICSTDTGQHRGAPPHPAEMRPGRTAPLHPAPSPAQPQLRPGPSPSPEPPELSPQAPVQTCTRSWAGSALAVLTSRAASGPRRRPWHLQAKPTRACPSWAGAGRPHGGAAAAPSPALATLHPAMLHPAVLAGITRCKALRAAGLGAHGPAAGGQGPVQVPRCSASCPPALLRVPSTGTHDRDKGH